MSCKLVLQSLVQQRRGLQKLRAGQTETHFRQQMWVLKIKNFAHKFPQNEGFPAPNLVFLEENFSTRGKFSDSLNLRGSCRPPPCHDAASSAGDVFYMFLRLGLPMMGKLIDRSPIYVPVLYLVVTWTRSPAKTLFKYLYAEHGVTAVGQVVLLVCFPYRYLIQLVPSLPLLQFLRLLADKQQTLRIQSLACASTETICSAAAHRLAVTNDWNGNMFEGIFEFTQDCLSLFPAANVLSLCTIFINDLYHNM